MGSAETLLAPEAAEDVARLRLALAARRGGTARPAPPPPWATPGCPPPGRRDPVAGARRSDRRSGDSRTQRQARGAAEGRRWRRKENGSGIAGTFKGGSGGPPAPQTGGPPRLRGKAPVAGPSRSVKAYRIRRRAAC